MIVSHLHRFIFMKTRKTAGTSIEIALSENCGPKDIISKIDANDEKLREELGFAGPQNLAVPIRKLNFRELLRLLIKREKTNHYNHCTADLVKHRIGSEKFDSYTSFCVVRNPWDRAVSMYWFSRNRGDRHAIDQSITFTEFIFSAPRELITDQDIYMIDGEIVIDHIVRFENLRPELDEVMSIIGIPSLTLPHAKGGTRKDKQHYSLMFDDKTRDFIAEMCAFEIKYFGYEFDDQR